MSNNTTTNKQILPILENTTDIFDTLLTYVSLIIVLTGFLGNSISFAIFRFHSEFKSMPSMVYLSFISITDTLSLLVWNLDHFFIPNFSVKLEAANEPICRILTFDQFFSLQASALLLSMLTVDRSALSFNFFIISNFSSFSNFHLDISPSSPYQAHL